MRVDRKKCLVLSFFALLLFNSFLLRNTGNYNNYNKKYNGNIEPYPSNVYVGSYIVPGVSESIPIDQIVKIGLLDDMNFMIGEHAWKGALLAAREINEMGGIMVNGTQYYIGLVNESTNEVYGGVPEGVIAAEYMINNHHPHFIIGGTTWGCLREYLEVIMDNKTLFLSKGTPLERLCANVILDYERYKYIFRVMPTNDTAIFKSLSRDIKSLTNHLNLTYGGTVDKIAFLREGGEGGYADYWVGYYLESKLSDYNLTVVADITFNAMNDTLADFETYWNEIETAEAQITFMFHFNNFYQRNVDIAQKYQEVQPHSLFFSFSLLSQTSPYWDDAKGDCQFEIVIQAIHNTSKTSLTIPFFNSFVGEYGFEPLPTGIGVYNGVYLLKHAVNESQSFNSDTIVTTLEKINASNPFTTAGGNLAFTSSHDLLAGYPFAHGVLCQYKYIDGTKVVIPSSENYPDFIATDSLRLPYWGIHGLLTDPPQPPGDFTLETDADNPDYDGIFNLTWTDSVGADNYSIYMSDNPIEYISKKFDLLAYQTATSPFSIDLNQGEYYFRVVAYNKTGETMSSDDVQVSISRPGSFYLDDDAGDPDPDGNFVLKWTPSEGADNYSVYRYNSTITSINESLTLLVNQTNIIGQSSYSFHVTRLSNGKYYFVVTAYNEVGHTLSNNRDVVVRLPFDWNIIIIVSIASVAGVASVVLVKKYLTREKKIEKIKKEHKLKKKLLKNNMKK
ncbi:MAG: ABC transporter substrate-binding protein [Promethearchaeota archaeon]